MSVWDGVLDDNLKSVTVVVSDDTGRNVIVVHCYTIVFNSVTKNLYGHIIILIRGTIYRQNSKFR